ncbi:urease accessory protein UreE [Aquibacillus koreensis]|uniref:Urease accessory protein UreE n=1 Tax=Aquibacillus koreensis TaxID=279446 RepID=A0A9X4ALK2_9BACI|nr:urease accessory protein UreE [Aquibacillus koreensis]MCT2534166.1 urease accessory protein UreE [Aquibacillus koreensis]MDC3422558.1 urease accessory protein UreE [Aquibacillus koreensis]
MLTKAVIGNVETGEQEHQNREWIELDWEELNKRILRKKTDKGTDVAIALDDKQPLKVGDILYQDDKLQVVIRTKKEKVYVVYPNSIVQMGKMAFELGNRHTPCLISENEIVVRFDETLERLFEEVGVDYEQTERRFKQPFKYRGHKH